MVLTYTPSLGAANLLWDPEWEREVSVLTDALGEQSLPPALAYDPVSCAGGRHHHNHSYEAAGEGNYLRHKVLYQLRN